MKPKIIFIHGMFLTAKCWDEWVGYFTRLGYDCEAVAWPHHEGEPVALRSHPPEGLGTLGLEDLYGFFRAVVRREAEPPVVIGHSLGGLIVQRLLADKLVRAGVGIASVAPNRMLAFDWGFMRNTASITNPFAGDEPFEMTPELFHRNFANTLGEAESRPYFDTLAVHESRQVLRDVMAHEGEIDLAAPHAPLLLIGAKEDEIIPSSLVRRNAHAYEDGRFHHEFAEFSGRGHLLCNQPGWEEVAEKIANWLPGHLTAIRS
jgi:alpha-beta hydrolase superfamily lysophospholipase